MSVSAGDQAHPTSAALVEVGPDGRGRTIAIRDRLFIGRECEGIDDAHRWIVDDAEVSRSHVEIQLDPIQDQAWLVDRSTNGTRLNGVRVERSTPVRLRPSDRISVGPALFEFCADGFAGTSAVDPRSTIRNTTIADLVTVVGDIVSFSSISEYTDDGVLMGGIDQLYSALRTVLTGHRGTLSNYVGDAFFATWDTSATADAAVSAVRFALDAVRCVDALAPHLALRDPAGAPVRMGWSVGSGPSAVSSMSGMLVTVLGDATNVTFRLSGIAGRDGWPPVVVTDSVHASVGDAFTFTEPAVVSVKGRVNPVTVFGVLADGDNQDRSLSGVPR